MAQGRDDFSAGTKRILARRVGLHCSFPGCGVRTDGPGTADGQAAGVGVAAHICAAAPGGPRYDLRQTPALRKSIDHGIWLCQTHARLIDADEARFPAELLRVWKAQAEEAARDRLGRLEPSQELALRPRQQLAPPPADFTGRAAELARLRAKLGAGATITGLRGLGGSGKTEADGLTRT